VFQPWFNIADKLQVLTCVSGIRSGSMSVHSVAQCVSTPLHFECPRHSLCPGRGYANSAVLTKLLTRHHAGDLHPPLLTRDNQKLRWSDRDPAQLQSDCNLCMAFFPTLQEPSVLHSTGPAEALAEGDAGRCAEGCSARDDSDNTVYGEEAEAGTVPASGTPVCEPSVLGGVWCAFLPFLVPVVNILPVPCHCRKSAQLPGMA
jgi:hypothetical protein